VGLLIDRDDFADEEFERFGRRLTECLSVLETLLQRPDFGAGEPSLGAELELSLVGEGLRPLPRNREIIAESGDPRLTVELDRFNLECNLRHGRLEGAPFSALRREIEDALAEVARAAAVHGGRAVMIGILPTLEPGDLGSAAMTETPRFRALSTALLRRRREPFHLNIHGEDPLELRCDDVTFEGAATSLQLHLRVAAADYARVYNAVQIATAPVLALAGNSPTFLGHRLWAETRVALFKQAVDDRPDAPSGGRGQARVSFGTGWVREGVLELFADAVTSHEPLLPVLSLEDPGECLRSGVLPKLEEMRLHAGTVWRWNRPVYDPADGGHLRIEMRALPAGPTITDMLANAAFLIGSALGLADEIDLFTASLSFEDAHRNFYRAARSGVEARLAWPEGPGGRVRERAAPSVALELVEVAARGLRRAGVRDEDFGPLLEVVAERATRLRTGAVWQRERLARELLRHERPEALRRMLDAYLGWSSEDLPVHAWSAQDR